jgi:glycosyltransferase involved in cell wall biosynthesis
MRVAVYCNRDLTAAHGTSVRVLGLTNQIAKLVDASLVSRKRSTEADPALHQFPLAARRGFETLSAAFPATGHVLKWQRDDRTLLATLQQIRPDIVHAHQHVSGYRLARLRSSLRRPVILDLHGIMHFQRDELAKQTRYGWLHVRAEKNLFDELDGLVVRSEREQDLVTSTFGIASERLHVVPDGVDLDFFSTRVSDESVAALRTRFGVAERPVFLFVGWFKQLGGILDLIRAFKGVKKAVPDAVLVAAGDGPLASDVRDLVAQHQLRDVVLPGVITRTELLVYQAMATVLVCPETQSVFNDVAPPIKLLECLASGKPVVATRLACAQALLKDGVSAVLAEPSQPDDLARAMIQVLDRSDATQIGGEGRRVVERSFSWRRSAERAVACYRTVLAKA